MNCLLVNYVLSLQLNNKHILLTTKKKNVMKTEVDKEMARMKRVQEAELYIENLKDREERLKAEIEVTPKFFGNSSNLPNPTRRNLEIELDKVRKDLSNSDRTLKEAEADPDFLDAVIARMHI